MQWTSFDGGASIGRMGSESGVIIRDSEHPRGARITLERAGTVAPYSITCGIYGCMAHTRFFSTEIEASQEFDLMAAALEPILQSSTTESDLIDSVGGFVEQFP
jgi:hypothetical protein